MLRERQEERRLRTHAELHLAKLSREREPRHLVEKLEILEEPGSADAAELDGQGEELHAEIGGVDVAVGVVGNELVEDTAGHQGSVLHQLRGVGHAAHVVSIVCQKTVSRDGVRDPHEHVIALMRGNPAADRHFLLVAHRTQRQRAVHAVEYCSDDRGRAADVALTLRMQKTAEITHLPVLLAKKLPTQRTVQCTFPRGSTIADRPAERREFGVSFVLHADIRGIFATPADLFDHLRDPRGEPRLGLLSLPLLQTLELPRGRDGVGEPRGKGGNGSKETSVGLSDVFGGDLCEEMGERVVRAVHFPGFADLGEELEGGVGEGRREGVEDLVGLLAEAGGAEEVVGAAETAVEDGRLDELRAVGAAQRGGDEGRDGGEPTAREGEVERVIVERFEAKNGRAECGEERQVGQVAIERGQRSGRLRFLAVGEDLEVFHARPDENPPLLGVRIARDLIGRPQPIQQTGYRVVALRLRRQIALNDIHAAQIAEEVQQPLLRGLMPRGFLQKGRQQSEDRHQKVHQQAIGGEKLVGIRPTGPIGFAEHCRQIEDIIAGERGGGEEGAENIDLGGVDSSHGATLGVENDGLLVGREGGGHAAESVFDHDRSDNCLVLEEMQQKGGRFQRFPRVERSSRKERVVLGHRESERRRHLAEIGEKLVERSDLVEVTRVQVARRQHCEVRLVEKLGEVREELSGVCTVFGRTLRK